MINVVMTAAVIALTGIAWLTVHISRCDDARQQAMDEEAAAALVEAGPEPAAPESI